MTPSARGLAYAAKRADTEQRMSSVAHLPLGQAALELGLSREWVRQYRKRVADAALRSAPQREAGAETANALADARRASGGLEKRSHVVSAGMWGLGDPASMSARVVSLVAEPWGKV